MTENRKTLFSKNVSMLFATLVVVVYLLSIYIVSAHIALAQISNIVNFVKYENPNHKIKIMYPSDWKIEEGTVPHFSVSFIAPSKTNSNSPPALLRLGVDNLPSPGVLLENFTHDQINDLKQNYPILTLWQLNSTFVGKDTPAKQLVFSATDSKQHEAKAIQVFAIKNNISYHITYIAKPVVYSEFLPIAKRMIDSFKILP
jgi:hypothetical protein